MPLTSSTYIPDVLCSYDLPGPTALAWLQHKGQVTVVDSKMAVSKLLPNSPCRRAHVAAFLLPRNCTACGLLAFWVWEGGPFPTRLEALCDQHPKSAPPHDICLLQRQLGPHETLDIAGLSVTTPLRTAVDLVCLPRDIFDVRVGMGRFVMFLHHNKLTINDCLERLRQNSRAVGYTTGRRRLEKLAARPEVSILLSSPRKDER